MWTDLQGLAKGVLKDWASVAGLATFLIYSVGYLTLRFHLAAIGVETDIGVLDQRYLFAGASFFIYTAVASPVAAALLAGLAWVWRRVEARAAGRIPLIGTVAGLVLIQFGFVKVFEVYRLFPDGKLPETGFITSILTGGDGWQKIYFSGMLASAAALAWLWWRGRAGTAPQEWRFWNVTNLGVVLLLLVLLPVTYGTLIYSKSFAAAHGTAIPQKAWLLWEGPEAFVFLVERCPQSGRTERRLLRLAKDQAKSLELGSAAGIGELVR